MAPRRLVTVGSVATLLALLTTACGGSSEPPAPTPAASPTPSSVQSASPASADDELPAATPVEEVDGARSYEARPNADWVQVAGGTAWVANVDKGVGRWDAATGRPLGSVGPGLDVCTAMDTGFGSLWVVDCASQRLFRFELATGRRLSAIKLPFSGIQQEGSVAAGGGGVFVVAAGGVEIARVDPRTNRVAGTFTGPEGAAGVRYGFGSLWVTSPYGDRVSRLDPRDGSVQATIEVKPGAFFLDVGAGAVWVLNNSDSEVLRIDAGDNTVSDTIDVSAVPVEGGDLAVGGGSVWARVSDALVARIDPATRQVTERFGTPKGSGSVDADADAVWISAHDVFAVYRVPIT